MPSGGSRDRSGRGVPRLTTGGKEVRSARYALECVGRFPRFPGCQGQNPRAGGRSPADYGHEKDQADESASRERRIVAGGRSEKEVGESPVPEKERGFF